MISAEAPSICLFLLGIFGCVCNLVAVILLLKSNNEKLGPKRTVCNLCICFCLFLSVYLMCECLHLMDGMMATQFTNIFPYSYLFGKVARTATLYTLLTMSFERFLSTKNFCGCGGKVNVIVDWLIVMAIILFSSLVHFPKFFELETKELELETYYNGTLYGEYDYYYEVENNDTEIVVLEEPTSISTDERYTLSFLKRLQPFVHILPLPILLLMTFISYMSTRKMCRCMISY